LLLTVVGGVVAVLRYVKGTTASPTQSAAEGGVLQVCCIILAGKCSKVSCQALSISTRVNMMHAAVFNS
jgi:hypothetical protein